MKINDVILREWGGGNEETPMGAFLRTTLGDKAADAVNSYAATKGDPEQISRQQAAAQTKAQQDAQQAQQQAYHQAGQESFQTRYNTLMAWASKFAQKNNNSFDQQQLANAVYRSKLNNSQKQKLLAQLQAGLAKKGITVTSAAAKVATAPVTPAPLQPIANGQPVPWGGHTYQPTDPNYANVLAAYNKNVVPTTESLGGVPWNIRKSK